LIYPDIIVILYLNKRYPWSKRAIGRTFLQIILSIVLAVMVSSLLTVVAHGLNTFEQGLPNVLLNNILIYSIVNAFLMAILEAWAYLDDSIKGKTINYHLEEEIKKREKLTIQLNESREQLDSILSNLSGAAYRCYFDKHYTMKYISEKIFEISGHHASEFTGEKKLTFDLLIHPEDKDYCRKTILDAVGRKSSYEFEYRIIHKNGDLVWVNENGKGIYNQNNQLEYLDGIITDITRRKEAEHHAKESDRRYREMMDFLPQPVFELDLKGNVVYGNKAGFEFFGPEPDDPNQKISAFDCFIKEDMPRILENIKKSDQTLLTEPTEFTAIKRDGSHCPVMIYGSPIVKYGKIIGRRGIIVDITERKKQEMKLLHAKEELERINNTLEQSINERTKQLTEANTLLLKVQKENLQSQFEVLKQQVNPHFLFNSLNVLTSLIKIDPDLAESFTERLSKVYRYVLENKEKDLVMLSTELEFLDAYLFLLEIRFMKKLYVDITIDRLYHEYLILPIAIQLIIENAIKHNMFSKANPLRIKIFVDEQQRLTIRNNLNLRETKLESTGVGLENIHRRYALVSDKKPEFLKTTDHFTARLPLMKPEKVETV